MVRRWKIRLRNKREHFTEKEAKQSDLRSPINHIRY
jgi:hypothetical protein